MKYVSTIKTTNVFVEKGNEPSFLNDHFMKIVNNLGIIRTDNNV